VKAIEVATPLASVVAVFVLAKLPLAPEPGAVKVTTAPLTGAPPEVTVATSGAGNAVPTVALCGVPLVVATVLIAAALFVRLKAADDPPATVAVTK
jgi:hypothetical protein